MNWSLGFTCNFLDLSFKCALLNFTYFPTYASELFSINFVFDIMPWFMMLFFQRLIRNLRINSKLVTKKWLNHLLLFLIDMNKSLPATIYIADLKLNKYILDSLLKSPIHVLNIFVSFIHHSLFSLFDRLWFRL